MIWLSLNLNKKEGSCTAMMSIKDTVTGKWLGEKHNSIENRCETSKSVKALEKL